MSWATFYFFRRILIDCTNISKFKNNDTNVLLGNSRAKEWTSGETSVFSLENISSYRFYFNYYCKFV